MKLKCLGSGSSGNCYILENDKEALIIEAGVRFKDVKVALDFDVSKICGVLVSHVHGDHSKYIPEYFNAGIPVFRPYDMDNEIAKMTEYFGKFAIKAFSLVHDVPCYGFLIIHPDMGRLVYITDTEYCKWKFADINHILIEANYSDTCMDTTNNPKRSHVLTGHMSIDTTVKFLRANQSPSLRNAVLLHLSESNSNKAQFKAAAERAVDCPVYVADKGLEIELNEFPF